MAIRCSGYAKSTCATRRALASVIGYCGRGAGKRAARIKRKNALSSAESPRKEPLRCSAKARRTLLRANGETSADPRGCLALPPDQAPPRALRLRGRMEGDLRAPAGVGRRGAPARG